MTIEKRQFERYYLTTRDTNIELQAAGLPAKLLVKGFFNWKPLGPCIIKDVSQGGAGILSPVPLNESNKYSLEHNNGDAIVFTVVHSKSVNKKLNFYGIQWFNDSSPAIAKLIQVVKSRLK